MHTLEFPGSVPISKPSGMTDEQCSMAWAKFWFGTLHKIIEGNGIAKLPEGIYAGVDSENFPFYLTAWQQNKEDLEALNRGEPVYIKTISNGLPPMAVFTDPMTTLSISEYKASLKKKPKYKNEKVIT